jgi:uncharacterized membrane protein YvbJ
MVYCHKCGKKNDDDAQYCTKCGDYIAESSSFEKNIERAAEEFGRKAEQFGKRMEKRAREFTRSMKERADLKTKQCPACGTEIDDAAMYCWKCGKKI